MTLRRELTRVSCAAVPLIGSVLATSTRADAQATATQPVSVVQLAASGPVFYVAPEAGGSHVDVRSTSVFLKRVSLHFMKLPLSTALDEVARQAGLSFSFPHTAGAKAIRVSLNADAITIASALNELLLGTGLDVSVGTDDFIALVPHVGAATSALTQAQVGGTIAGRVTDADTKRPLSRARILLDDRTLRGATTDDSGSYRFTNIPAGTYTVRALRLGYVRGQVPVTIAGSEEVRADFALTKSASKLDEVVVTGTVVAMEQKASPTPVSVISAQTIADEQPRSITQVVRENVPGAVAFDQSLTTPQNSAISVRGSSSLLPMTGVVKVYIDGIDVSDHSNAAVDPASIDHIELIRGPEAATIYGSDAIDGVMQIFTKQGDPTRNRPEVTLETSLGDVESPYKGYGNTLRQDYHASLLGGTPAATYYLGGGYTHTGAWVPEGESSIPSGYGGLQIEQKQLTLDVFGRYYAPHTPEGINPDLASTWSYFSKPFYTQYDTRLTTYGAHVAYAATSWWLNSFTVGVDDETADGRQTQPRLTTPADTFLTVNDGGVHKNSLAYNTAVSFRLTRALSGNIVGGVDYYDLTEREGYASGATNTNGTIQTDPLQPPLLTRSEVTNAGAFAQAALNVSDALFLTAGVRAERNSAFGSSLGTPVFPRFGLSFVRRLGAITTKLRASYGEAIKPPDPGLSESTPPSPQGYQIANPHLGPERQRGWDAGVDVNVGAPLSLSATYYDQTATDLIESVPVDSAGLVVQNQNVGRVRNTGVELQGAWVAGIASAQVQYAYTRARVEALGDGYTGDLRVGDQTLQTPHHTGGASVAISPWAGTHVAAGVAYIGGWTYYDDLAEFRCYGGTGPCQPTTRDYLKQYPGYARFNLSATQSLTRSVAVFVSIDNLTGETVYDGGYDIIPKYGRITMAGMRLHY